MVLQELGSKLGNALKKLNTATVVDENLVSEIIKEISIALLQSDVNVKYVKQLRDNVNKNFKIQFEEGANLRKLVQQLVVDELTSLLDCGKKAFEPKRGKQNVVMFVGLQGSGKTTTCAKYAYHYKQQGWRVALVCADTFRAGAFDQLKQNSGRIKVPFYGSYTETDPVQIAVEGVEYFKKEGFEMIIVDTSGRHMQESELFEEMKQIEKGVKPDDIIFIMDSKIGQACHEQAQAFKESVEVGSVIITKLDGHAKGGGALSAVAATQSPVVFIGVGEMFNEFEEFDPQSFIKRLLGLGDLNKLMSKVTTAINVEDQEKLMASLAKGNFCLEDMRAQFQSILKLGSLNSFMSMIPGIGGEVLTKGGEKESINRIKRFLCMLDSMNEGELSGKAPLTACRIVRVARGSGTQVVEVHQLLDEFKRIKQVVDKLGKVKFGKGGNDMSQLTRNPGQLMNKMKGIIDPQMLNSLGGMGNIMEMVKNMGNMPGMGDMLKQFGGNAGSMPNMQDMAKKMQKKGRR